MYVSPHHQVVGNAEIDVLRNVDNLDGLIMTTVAFTLQQLDEETYMKVFSPELITALIRKLATTYKHIDYLDNQIEETNTLVRELIALVAS